jgi:hypothetical protein
MSPEQQRIAIAEACGWTIDAQGVWYSPGGGVDFVPDYYGDLNAMHETEKLLTPEQAHVYSKNLQVQFESQEWNHAEAAKNYGWHATAAQRAEAFLKTLGKWTDKAKKGELK